MAHRRGWWELAGAAFVTLSTGCGAFFLSQPAFATTPPLEWPGTIFIGVQTGSAPTPVRVEARMAIRPSPHNTEFILDLLGDPTTPVHADKAGDLILGFCGPLENVRLRKFGDDKVLNLQPLPLPSGEYSSGAIGFGISLATDCQMIVIPKSELTGKSIGQSGYSWALKLHGETSVPTEASAGAQRRYAFPNIVTTTLYFLDLNMDPIAVESMASIAPEHLPREFTPTVISPELNDSGIMRWTFPVEAARGGSGYILTGTDQQKQADIQSQLFIASGLSGVTGGALIWFFSSMGVSIQKGHRPAVPSADSTREQQPSSPPEELDEPHSHRTKVLAASALSVIAGCGITWLFRTLRSK